MDDVGSLIGAIALWIGVSVGLWWLHRRRLHGRQDRQLEQARRAIALSGEAPAVFDAIRAPAADDDSKLATLALLKRIQEQGGFFDTVHGLKVQLQASLGIDDHAALSEILNLRRDLWAASEILLVEDPAALGPSFAEAGAFERIRGEAAHLLFKLPGAAGEDDLIDLRLSLAEEEARNFADALAEAIRDAREKDRLPTWSEVVAYPLAFFRAIPRAARTAYAFAAAFFAYSADAARAIRESEAVERGKTRLREARQDWPERLSAGFERASRTARGSGTALRRHYDFLVTAYDFQTKYEDVLRRAPDLTERGRQFIARLELAERSERLRLTSANATVWLARRLLDGSAHALAAVQDAAAWAGGTTFGQAAAMLLAPVPARGRETPAFRSYAMALAASGLSEAPRQPAAPAFKAADRPKAAAKGKAAPKGRGAKAAAALPAQAKGAGTKKQAAAAAKLASTTAKPAAPTKAKAAKAVAQVGSDRKSSRPFFAIYATKGEPPAQAKAPPAQPRDIATDKSARWFSGILAGKGEPAAPLKAAPPTAPVQAAAKAAPAPAHTEPKPIPVISQNAVSATPKRKGKAAARVAEPTPSPASEGAAPAKPAQKPRKPEKTTPAPVETVPSAAAEPQAKAPSAKPIIIEVAPAPLPEPAPVPSSSAPPLSLPDEDDAAPPLPSPKRPSFLKRLFGPSKARMEREAEQEAERLAEALAEALSAGEIGAPLPETGGAPTLMAKLSSLEEAADAPDEAAPPDLADEGPELAEPEPAEEDAIEPQDEPGPLTLSIMELQAKIGAKPPQIRSFPWLRG